MEIRIGQVRYVMSMLLRILASMCFIRKMMVWALQKMLYKTNVK